jgi:hypothetical protein
MVMKSYKRNAAYRAQMSRIMKETWAKRNKTKGREALKNFSELTSKAPVGGGGGGGLATITTTAKRRRFVTLNYCPNCGVNLH